MVLVVVLWVFFCVCDFCLFLLFIDMLWKINWQQSGLSEEWMKGGRQTWLHFCSYSVCVCLYIHIYMIKGFEKHQEFLFSDKIQTGLAKSVADLKTFSEFSKKFLLIFLLYCSVKLNNKGVRSRNSSTCVCGGESQKKIHEGYRSVIVKPWNSWKHGSNFLPNLGRLECIPKIQTEIVKFKNFLLVPNPAAPGWPNCLQPGHYSKAWSLATNSTY